MSGSTERTSRHTSMPVPSGSRPSRIATCGRSAGMRRVASWASPGLADDLDVALGLEQLADPAADHLVVVEEEHADGCVDLGVSHGPTVDSSARDGHRLIGPVGGTKVPAPPVPGADRTVDASTTQGTPPTTEPERTVRHVGPRGHDPSAGHRHPRHVGQGGPGVLEQHRITATPVLDRGGRIEGIVSEADLIRDLVQPDPRTHEWPARPRPARPAARGGRRDEHPPRHGGPRHGPGRRGRADHARSASRASPSSTTSTRCSACSAAATSSGCSPTPTTRSSDASTRSWPRPGWATGW